MSFSFTYCAIHEIYLARFDLVAYLWVNMMPNVPILGTYLASHTYSLETVCHRCLGRDR